MHQIQRIVSWIQSQGDAKAFGRLRLRMLPLTVSERIVLDKVTPGTSCSPAFLEALRQAATDIVGQPCPF